LSRTVVDVGASFGLFSNFIANLSAEFGGITTIRVFAVEPIPHVAIKIKEHGNLKVIQTAILSAGLIPSSGAKDFKVMKNSELSTFLEINPNLDDEIWNEYVTSLEVAQEIPVKCITLQSLMLENKIAVIDFLKIDTQGTDVDVLLSAGPEIKRIMACVLELPYSKDSAIYADEISLSQGIDTLKEYGFTPMRIVPNSYGECNVFFRSSICSITEYFQIEEDLHLGKAPTLKIGKHNPLINMGKIEKTTYFLKCTAVALLTKFRFRKDFGK